MSAAQPDAGRALLRELTLFRLLPEDVRKLLVDSFTPLSAPFGTPIVREGEEADAFYVLVSGVARVVKKAENGEEIALGVLRPGDTFGEMALLGGTTRATTVRASGDVEALKLDSAVFEALVRNHPQLRQYLELQGRYRSLSNFLHLYSPFARVPIEGLTTLLRELRPLSVPAGTLVMKEGDVAGSMYIVEAGRLRVFREASGGRHYLAYLRRGDFFGEMSAFRGEPRAASVEAVSECQLLCLERQTFEKLARDYPEFRRQIEERIGQYKYEQIARVPLDFAREILPAETSAHEKVSPRQVDVDEAGVEPADPFATKDGRFVKRPGKIRRFPLVRQIDEMDCGAAALAMVCRQFGRAVNLARIRQLVFTSIDGTSLRAICRAATELGLAARAVKASKARLLQMPLPAIVHWEGNHWIVLYDVGNKFVRVADPAVGRRRIERQEFDDRWTGYAALFDYTEDFERAPEEKASRAWLWQFVRPFFPTIARALGLSVVVSVLQMMLPVFTQVIVDRVLVEGDVPLLHLLIFSMLTVLALMTVGIVVQRYLLSFVAVRIDASALDFVTRKLLTLPMSYFNNRRTGDIQRRLEGIRQIREFLVQSGVRGAAALIQMVVAIILMFVYSSLLATVFLSMMPIYGAFMFFSARWLRPTLDELEEALGRYQSHQIDALKGMETVKAMGAEGTFRELMLNEFLALGRRRFKADLTILSYEGAIQAVSFLSMVLFLWVGAYQVMMGRLTIGGLMAFNSLLALANQPAGTVMLLWDNVQLVSILLNRLNDVLLQEPEQGVDHSHLLPVRSLEGRIRFQNVGFRYGGPESPPILEGITFEAPPGTTIAIVGRSGSGKTTLIKCLAGLIEPTEGTIFYDSLDLRSLSYRTLRRQIGFVLQDNHLFADTIARNIAFGEEEPDMDQVLWAARLANAHDFIDRLPLGYDTRIGETGIAISGGQRQRVAIARALYQRPSVLIFDEATSSLDTESERAIQENMARLLRERTCFVIAHRLSTIREADVILVLERGKLVEQGRHDELMKRQGLYYYLCSQQLSL
jgi:HlyB family type I secretion system ABC transporter